MEFTKRESSHSRGSDNAVFLKIQDGQSVTGIFRGEVYEFYQAWPNGGQKQIFTKPTPGASLRFKLNFIVYEDGAFKAKIWEFPRAVYNQLASINEVYPLEKTKVRITRHGTETKTSYTILPLVNEPLGPKTLAEIESVKLNILNATRNKDVEVPGFEEPMPDNFDQIPF